MKTIKESLYSKVGVCHSVSNGGFSGKMLAICDYLIDGEPMVEPRIIEMAITSDGMVLAGHEGDIGLNDLIGYRSDFCRNVAGVMDAISATTEERDYIQSRMDAIMDWALA